MQNLEKIELIVLHHTQNNKSVEEIKKDHLKRGFEDIGYHYLLDKQGVLIKGRPEKFAGAHVRSHNHNSLGIALIGNFDEEKPTEAQIHTLIIFLKEKLKQFGLKPDSIKPHNSFSEKSCPGKNLDLDAIKKAVEKDI